MLHVADRQILRCKVQVTQIPALCIMSVCLDLTELWLFGEVWREKQVTLPRVGPASHNWPTIKFDLASRMFLLKDNNESEYKNII